MIESLRALAPAFREFLPLLIVLAAAALVLGGAHTLLRLRERRRRVALRFSYPLTMLAITAVAIVAALLALPVSDATRGQLLSLLGIVLTAMIAFSSTTFVANAMAGLMLRAVGNFRAGDWVRVGDQFGRVTERGLFHTELQTEDRDLATLPNLYLVTNPVKVVRESGTIVSVTLSLGYDRHHAELEALLTRAAQAAGLEEGFVQVRELGNFSVTYRVAGFLSEVKNLLTVRSRLFACVLDTLHGAGVEIVSPTFMNQRPLPAEARFIPVARAPAAPAPEAPEKVIFDKAEEKASLAEMRAERERLQQEIDALEKSAKAGGPEDKAALEAEIAARRSRLEAVAAAVESASAAGGEPADA